MFLSLQARLAMKRAKLTLDDRRDSPRFELPLAIRSREGDFVEHYGRLGINGFYFEAQEAPLIGQVLQVRVVLVGLGIEVNARATVASVKRMRGHVAIIARFDSIPFETERMIARWLDLMQQAHQLAIAV